MIWATERKHDPLHPDCTCKECREAFEKRYPLVGEPINIPPHVLEQDAARAALIQVIVSCCAVVVALFIYFTGVIR